MSNRFPPWLVVPLALTGAVATTWIVGAVQPKSGAASAAELPSLAAPPPNDADSASAGSPDTSSSSEQKMFPDFEGQTVGGANFSLAANKGKVVLINFWATWCGPCKMEIPDLIELQKKYGPRGFTVVGLSEDEEFSRAVSFAQAAGMNYPVMKTPDGLAATLGISGLPTSVLIGKDGKIITAMSGVDPTKSMAGLWAPQIEKAL